jgi:hypothetical protein
MKRSFAAVIAIAVFMLVLISRATSLTAQVSPLPNVTLGTTVSVSPLATPLPHWEPSYNPHPKKVNPRAVPFVNEVGETIVKQIVIERPYQDPIIYNFKAQPPKPVAPEAGLLTFQSPLELPSPYKTYLPLVNTPANAQVLVITYIGYTPTITPTALAQNLIANIARGTMFHGVESSAIGFEMVGNRVEISNTRPPKRTQDNYWGMWKIYADHNICARIATEGIDEVWVIIDGNDKDPNYVWGWEWNANGPLWSTGEVGSAFPPNCGKQLFTIGLNFNRGDDMALEAWVHSTEAAFYLPELSGAQACDFPKPDGYGLYSGFWDPDCSAYGYSSASAFTVLPSLDGTIPGVCGDAHFPPNIARDAAVQGSWRYDPWDYSNSQVMPSRCPDWQWNILTNTVPISCGVWGCNEVGYLTWWMQNIPGKNNNLHGRDSSLRPNWWDFRLHR